MSLPARPKNRRVLPRWRDTRAAIETGEMRGLQRAGADEKARAQQAGVQRLVTLQREFGAKPSVGRAAELTGAAALMNRPDVAEEAAAYLLLHAEQTTPAALASARTLLALPAPGEATLQAPQSTGLLTVQAEVRRLRPLLREFPHNPLMHLDLARAYAALGQAQRAERHLQVALALAPQHRFALRTAVRFHVHTHDPRAAVTLLRRSDRTPHDPWLIAAEISASMVAGVAPRFVRRARDLVENWDLDPLHISELAAALGTLELKDGGTSKRVRKMFRQALEQPTENAVAQVQWVAPQVQVPLDEQQLKSVPRNFEMRAWERYSLSRFEAARDAFECWLQDEPYAATPVIMAAYLAGALDPTPTRAIELTRLGLTAHPADEVMLNNMAYYLAIDDQLDDAETYLRRAQAATAPGNVWNGANLVATQGLLLFRRGQPDAGVHLYEAAAALARRSALPQRAVIAQLNLARELLRGGDERAPVMLLRALEEARACTSPDVDLAVAHLRTQVQRLGVPPEVLPPTLFR